MDDTSRLRLIVVGLVLAAIAGGYFVYTQATKVANPEPSPSVQRQALQLRPIVTATPSAMPATLGLATKGQTTKGGRQPLPPTGVSSLPNTGAPVALLLTLASSAATIGWGLKQYPR